MEEEIDDLHEYIKNLSGQDRKALFYFKRYIDGIDDEILSIIDADKRAEILNTFHLGCLKIIKPEKGSLRITNNDYQGNLYFAIMIDKEGTEKLSSNSSMNKTSALTDLVSQIRKKIEDDKLEQRGHWGIGLTKIERRNQRSYKAGPVYIHLGSKTQKSNGGKRRRLRTVHNRRKARKTRAR